MASESGTATDYLDLLSKLKTFLTTDADLIAASQTWTSLKDTSVEFALPDLGLLTPERHLYLEGPGLSGTDTIHVNIRAYRDPSNISYFNWDIRAAVGFDGGESFDTQPGSSPIVTSSTFGGPRITLANSSMNYWFVANGRRFIVVADVNGTWATMYAGFMLPYATPSEMPYPMYIAGNAGAEDTDSTEVSDKVGSIFDPVGTLVTPGTNSAYLRDFNGGWISISNYAWATGISRNNQSTGAWVWPYNWMYSEDLAGDIIIQNPDGSTTTLPCVIHASINGGNVFGELDGVVFMSGVSRSPADTLTIGGDTYLVVRSSFRQNTSFDFAAINLA